MPLIDVKCLSETCGNVFEHYRPLSEWPKTPACPQCAGETEQAHLPKRANWTVDPVVVFKAPDGTFRFPGDTNGQGADKYARMGFERVEIRGAAEMRSFERKMNAHEFSRASRHVEQKQRMREERERQTRSTLRDHMSRMTRLGRDVARAAMDRNDKKPRERAQESGFYSEVFSMDRSNREDSRSTSGHRRRD